MLAYIRKIPRMLQNCSERLINDHQIVAAAVQRNGLELQYASLALQEDKELVIQACRNNGHALQFCPPGAVRDELMRDCDFMRMVVCSQQAGSMYRLVCDESLRGDREIVLEALAHGLSWRYCPKELKLDPAFVLEAIRRKADQYLEMPLTMQLDIDFARAAATAESASQGVFSKALALLPALKRETQVVLSIARRGEPSFVEYLFSSNDLARDDVKDNKEIMMAALLKSSPLFGGCSDRLKGDVDVFMAAMDERWANRYYVLQNISNNPSQSQLLREHPEIFVKAIQVSSDDAFLSLLLPREFWSRRDIAQAWINRGWWIPSPDPEPFKKLLRTDWELALDVAKNRWKDFGFVGAGLRGDRLFMEQAVKLNGRVLRDASPELRQDMSMVVRAVAQTSLALSGATPTQKAVQAYLQDKLALYETFIYEFLADIAIRRRNTPPALRSPLTLLNRDMETTQALQRKIAAFLGVPLGEELARIRRALFNLTYPEHSL